MRSNAHGVTNTQIKIATSGIKEETSGKPFNFYCYNLFMRHFILSDIHFSHKNILKYNPATRGQYPSVDDMNERFIANFNNQVTENDHTYILGDIGFCKPEQTMEFLKMMNGRKTIIHGNHDRELVASSVFQNPEQRRLAGIIEDTPYKVVSHTVDGAKYGIILFHFRIASWDGAHHGSIHFYGHEHGNGPVIDARCMDIGVDTNNMNPYLLDSAVRLVCKKDKVVSGHHDGTR